MHWLKLVAQNHNEFIKYVHKMGGSTHAEDLVQEMYLRLNKYKAAIKFNEDGTVPKSYIYRILFNLFKDYKKSSGKFYFTDIEGCVGLTCDETDFAKHEAYDKIVEDTINSIDDLDRFEIRY